MIWVRKQLDHIGPGILGKILRRAEGKGDSKMFATQNKTNAKAAADFRLATHRLLPHSLETNYHKRKYENQKKWMGRFKCIPPGPFFDISGITFLLKGI